MFSRYVLAALMYMAWACVGDSVLDIASIAALALTKIEVAPCGCAGSGD